MTEPPSGYPPPVSAQLRDGETLDLRALAQEICARYRAEFPDEQERYGDPGMAEDVPLVVELGDGGPTVMVRRWGA